MKKMFFGALLGILFVNVADARDILNGFSREVNSGIDLIGARNGGADAFAHASGTMGDEVYADGHKAQQWDMFVPTSAYVRMGGGITLDFATDKADIGGEKQKSSDSYTYQFGLGWNMSPYVRSEIGFQNSAFKFSDAHATNQQGFAMLYFDLARRYVERGDVTRRRSFIPFIGVGAGAGYYEFEGVGGAHGVAFAAPRAEAGFTLMLTDLMGLDFAYQYQMMHGKGFGWNTDNSNTSHISNVVASLRFNF